MHKLFQKKSRLLCLTLALALAFCALPSAVFAETGDEEIDPVPVSTGTVTSAKAITRAEGETGPLYTVASGDTLTVSVKIDGNRAVASSTSGPLVEVQQGGTLILNSGAELCNNAETAIVSNGGTVIMNGGTIYNCGSLSKTTTAAATKTEYRLSEECDLYKNVAEPLKIADQSKYLQGGMTSLEYLNSVLADWADNLDKAQKAYESDEGYDSVSNYAAKTYTDYKMVKRFMGGLDSSNKHDQTDFGPWVLVAFNYWDDGDIAYCSEESWDFWSSENSEFRKNPFGTIGGTNYSGISIYKIPSEITHIVTINAGDPIESLDAEETYGGAIYADGGSTVTINGGKIGGDAEIADSNLNELDHFENGNVAAFGGALYIKGDSESTKSTLTISGGEFAYNDTYHGKNNAWSEADVSTLSETGFGGAIYAGEYANVVITGGSFTHNRAHSGGVLYVADNATAVIGTENGGEEGPLFEGNTCTFGQGGAIAVAGGTLTMESGKLHNNQAFWPEIGTNDQGNGGGVALMADGSTFNLRGGVITGNISVYNGGGIAMLNDTDNVFNMTGGTLKDNVSPNAQKTRDFIDPTARGSELYVGSGNKQITLSGGEIINSDITAANSDNSAIYLNNTLSSDSTNFIKLDGVKLEGVIYLTQVNTLPITATENCPEDIKLNFHLSDGYTANSVVVDVKTNGGDPEDDKALAEKLLGNATIVNPNNRILGKKENGDIYIITPKTFDGAIYENSEKTTLYGKSGQMWNYNGSSLVLPDPYLKATSPTPAANAIITYSYGFVGIVADNLASKESGQYSTTKPTNAGYYYVRARIEEPAADPSGVPSVGYVYTGPFFIQSKPITVTIDNRSSSTSSSSLAKLTWSIPAGSLAAGDANEDLKITLTTDAVPGKAGTYKITGTWENRNYNVTFLPKDGAVYTIKKGPSYSGSSHTTSDDVIERNDFIDKHETILKADADKIALGDEAKILAALKDYDALSKDAQYLLDEEHGKLLTLKARIDALRAEEAAKTETNKPAPSKNPTTGDFTGLELPAILALVGIGLFGASALTRKRRDNR